MFCSKCGNKIGEGELFCGACGNRVSVDPAPNPAPAPTPVPVKVKVQPQPRTPEREEQSRPAEDTPRQPAWEAPYGQPAGGDMYRNDGNFTFAHGNYGQAVPPYAEPAPKKKSKAPIVILVILLVLVLLAGAGAAVYMFTPIFKVEEEKVNVNSEIKDANANAKVVYNLVAEKIADNETMGISPAQSISDMSAYYNITDPHTELGNDLYGLYESDQLDDGWVYIGSVELNGKTTFFVQYWEEEDSEFIGQYPDAVSKGNYESAERGVYLSPAE